MKTRLVTLNDWPAVRECWQALKNSRYAWRIDGTEAVVQAFFVASLTSPMVKVFLAETEPDTPLSGILIVQHMHDPIPDLNGTVRMVPSLFIRAVYTTCADATQKLNEALETYARSVGAVAIHGNCRLDFPDQAAFVKYGFRATHKILRKEL